IPTEKVLEDARKREKQDFGFYEWMTDEVKEFFEEMERKPEEVKA
ncbi:MAG: ferredoxin oxidoreductase, partial [Aquificaceae bacterium]|nr:ferredoxin oxidoreductase [Aquificaceae bacterium]